MTDQKLPSQAQIARAGDVNASLTHTVGSEGELSGLDKKLLRMASNRMSPEEMSEELGGISPARCAQRVREILQSHDWLSIIEQKALLMMDMIELKDHLQEIVRAESGGGLVEGKDGDMVFSFGDPRWSANLIRLLKELRSMIEMEQKNVDDAKSQIRSAHAQLMVSAIELAFNNMMFNIRKNYPDVNETILRGFMEDAMPKAFQLIETRTAE